MQSLNIEIFTERRIMDSNFQIVEKTTQAILTIIKNNIRYDDWGNASIPDVENLIEEIEESMKEAD